jgi:Tol biopolymer transport system component
MKNKIIFLTLTVIAAFCLPLNILAYNNTSLNWKTIETDHFRVHFHQGAEWTAGQAAQIAEEVYPFITGLYQHEPNDKVDLIIKDTEDYANGAAFFYDNKMEIWATNLEFGFRGTTRWLRNVITHEFAHMVNIQAAMKFSRRVPALYLQWIDFEKEKRPDVLSGYPTNIFSYPIAGEIVPPWFAEGTAQYMSPSKQTDCWDTHRDMILRSAVLEDNMLTYDEMGFFGKNGLEGEQVYDHGYGLTRFIAEQYGAEALRDIINALSSVTRLTMDSALKQVVGKDGQTLYDEWRLWMLDRYQSQAAPIQANLREGKVIADGGFMTIAPVFSPDGKQIVFLSNKDRDYAILSLWRMDANGGNRKLLKPGVSSRAAWTPDGSKLVYSKKEKIDRFGSVVNDLYMYDFAAKKEKQLTHGLRAGDAAVSPDGNQIVCVVNGDGSHKMVAMDLDGQNVHDLFLPDKGTQLYRPVFSPDGGRVMFSIFVDGTRDIAVISSDGTGFAHLLSTQNDERDPAWSPDGKSILFASDRTGVFNIYQKDLTTGRADQLTNVIGGAFMPVIDPAGKTIVYSTFHSDGYSIARLDLAPGPVAEYSGAEYARRDVPADPCQSLKLTTIDLSELPDSDAPGTTAGTIQDAADYKRTFTSFQFFPRFLMYEREPRVGLFLLSTEILDKQSFFIGSSVGFNKEFDAFLSWELREFYPTLFVEAVRIREYYSDRSVFDDGAANLDLQYDLWQADVGLRLEFQDIYSFSYRNELALYYTHGEYNVHITADFFNKYGEYTGSDRAGWKYYIGNQITARYHYKNIPRAVDSDINPRGGRDITVQYMHAFDDLFTSGEFEYGFNPDFEENNYNQYSLDWREHIGLPYLRHSLHFRLYGAVIDKSVDDFFWLYVGGRDLLRGYTYYSIGGKKAFLGSVAYNFPIVRNINKQFLHFYFQDIYGSIFCEAANAWNEDKFVTKGYEKAAGYELRASLGSFYTYPAAFSLVAAYPFDEATYFNPNYEQPPVIYNKKWSYYLTLGFTF